MWVGLTCCTWTCVCTRAHRLVENHSKIPETTSKISPTLFVCRCIQAILYILKEFLGRFTQKLVAGASVFLSNPMLIYFTFRDGNEEFLTSLK